MKYLIHLFIFLISFFAPTQAINAAIPVQIGSYSNPIEPIKPKASKHKFAKKPIKDSTHDAESNLIVITWVLGIIFVGGLVVFSIGFLQGMILLFWLGLGLEGLTLLGLVSTFLISLRLEDWGGFLFLIIAFVFLPIALFLKGLLLLILGLIAASLSTWIIGLGLLLLAVIIFVIIRHISRNFFDKPIVRF